MGFYVFLGYTPCVSTRTSPKGKRHLRSCQELVEEDTDTVRNGVGTNRSHLCVGELEVW